ncbi:MAG: DUF4870 domain-containing protein [Methanophagales archaeon ANME-1-THS]|nr:MAG: DUF4870 domain-containing protein [Methanophagales archaeon ANME-1-THS]
MGKTSMGLEENIAGLLCYVLGWITGIVFLVLEKENKFVRFHAWQSIATFLPLSILAWILGAIGVALWWLGGFIFSAISWLIWIIVLILWLILMFKAYQGEMYKLPIVGDFAEARTK